MVTHYKFETVLAKTRIVRTKTEFNLLAQFTDTLNIYPFPVYQVLNVNRSTFLKGIFPTLLSHGLNNGTHGGHQLGSGDQYLLPLAMWLTGVLLATVWASWLLMGCPKREFFPPPTPLPIQPTPLLSVLTTERDGKIP